MVNIDRMLALLVFSWLRIARLALHSRVLDHFLEHLIRLKVPRRWQRSARGAMAAVSAALERTLDHAAVAILALFSRIERI